MRIYKLHNGFYKGEYKIYESREEFESTGLKYKQWHSDNIEIGDWIEADDGYILQCLNISKPVGCYSDPRYSYWSVRFYKFCVGTFKIKYNAKKNTYLWQRLLAYQSNSPRMEVDNQGKKHIEKKIAFARLIFNGISPYNAYIQCKFRVLNKNALRGAIAKLLIDKNVVNELKKLGKEYNKDIMSEQEFTDYIKDFITNVKKGSKNHLDSIVFLLKVMDKL